MLQHLLSCHISLPVKEVLTFRFFVGARRNQAAQFRSRGGPAGWFAAIRPWLTGADGGGRVRPVLNANKPSRLTLGLQTGPQKLEC